MMTSRHVDRLSEQRRSHSMPTQFQSTHERPTIFELVTKRAVHKHQVRCLHMNSFKLSQCIQREHPKLHIPHHDQEASINGTNPNSPNQNVKPSRHHLAPALPPRHNRQLRLKRTHRQRHHQHANLGPPRKHLKMGILL
jgi:hypothetical protein